MPEYFDSLETRAPAVRTLALLDALSRQVAHAKAHAPYFAEVLRDVDPRALDSRAALAALQDLYKMEIKLVVWGARQFFDFL